MAHLDHATTLASRPAPIDLAGAVVVRVHGEVDGTTCPQLLDRLLAYVRSTHHLILDLGGVSFFGAAGLTVLVQVREAALLRDCRLCVVAPTRTVRLPLMITGLTDVFDLHADLADALVCRELPAGPRLVDPRQPGDLR